MPSGPILAWGKSTPGIHWGDRERASLDVTNHLTLGRDRWAVALILLLGCLVFVPFWFQGLVFVPGDVLDFIYPWKKELMSPPDLVYNLEIFDIAVFFYPQDD